MIYKVKAKIYMQKTLLEKKNKRVSRLFKSKQVFKACVRYFHQIFIFFTKIIALQKL